MATTVHIPAGTAGEFLFVSCDIVGHSLEPDIRIQVQHARAINAIVDDALKAAGPDGALWFSGGDGGHVAFADIKDAPHHALRLLAALRTSSLASGVSLRVVGSTGRGELFTGAGGRRDMVGPGLNLAARLVEYGGAADRVVVTDEFRRRCKDALDPGIRLHERRTIRGLSAQPQDVWLLSVDGQFTSTWSELRDDGSPTIDPDRTELRQAEEPGRGLAVLYRAKRLLQVNPVDSDAIRALRGCMGSEAGRIGSSGMLAQIFADVSLGQEFIRAAVLVERIRGDVLFRAGDEGRTMFLILRGRLAGFLPAEPGGASLESDFEIGPGELVGELAFALKTRRGATLVCIEDCSLLAFSQQALLAAAASSPILPQVTRVLESIATVRILQNTCRTATYLSGHTRTGPLGAFERPWLELNPFSRTISIDWRQGDLRLDTPAFNDAGLYILAGGMLTTGEGTVLQPHGAEPPILRCNLPGSVVFSHSACQLSDDVTILFIGRAGLEQFGAEAYRKMSAEVRQRTGGRAKSSPGRIGMSAVEGLLRVSEGTADDRAVDVVFVHGLDGDARNTWQSKNLPESFWPAWLAQDVPGAAVWSLGYEVSSTAWKGTTMPLVDRATNALATLETQGLGGRPIVFVCHSLGGLLVKQMLRHGLDYGLAGWKSIAKQTKGIVFLSTPHSGSDISSWLKYLNGILRLTVSATELEAHDPRLRELNTWFRNCALTPDMRIDVYCEKQTVSGVLVVNETSADPGLPGVVPIPLDETHISICKPGSRDKLVYAKVKKLVAEIARA
jgi:predicted alpha/beta hydrolase family esterase